ncbi:MAG: RIP metalloprotease RseP [Leptospiraceae bacterium]|nr:RIP metalloprotease RseP [Leptospiraceae bacterium]
MLLIIFGALFMLGISIFIHELGHLLCGKLVGVEARIFSIGYGKGIWKKRVGGTTYQITNIPFGGYVMFKGDRYGNKLRGKKGELLSTPPLKRMIPVLGGPLFNLFLGFFIFVILALLGDTPAGNKIFIDPSYSEFSPAYSSGLRSGDKIVSVNGVKTESFEDIFVNIGLSKGEAINIEYLRNSKTKKATITPEIDSRGGRPTIGVSPFGERTIVINFTYGEQFNYWLQEKIGSLSNKSNETPSKLTRTKNKYQNLSTRALAFLEDGDEILSVEGKKVATIGELQKILADHLDETVLVKVSRKKFPLLTPWAREEVTVSVPVLGSNLLEFKNVSDPKLKGISTLYNIYAHQPNIDILVSNLSIEGKKFKNFEEVLKFLKSLEKDKVKIEVSGLGFTADYKLTPIGLLGFKPSIKFVQEKSESSPGFFEAIKIASYKIYQNVSMSLKALQLLITGFMSPADNLSGPVGIIHFAGASIEYGFFTYLDFIARISIALMIMNLLPIPIADGGHLVLYFYEAIAGKPLPMNVIENIFKIGFFFLLLLAIFVTFNDVMRIFR